MAIGAGAAGWIQLVLAAGAAASTIDQGQAAERASKRAEQTDAINAERAAKAAKEKAEKIRRRGLLILGEQRAQRAATGGTLQGSFLTIQGETARAAEQQALGVIFGGETERFNFLSRGARSRFEGSLAKNRSIGSSAQILGGATITAQRAGSFSSTGGVKTGEG